MEKMKNFYVKNLFSLPKRISMKMPNIKEGVFGEIYFSALSDQARWTGTALMKKFIWQKFYLTLVGRDWFDALSNIGKNLYFDLNKRVLGSAQSHDSEIFIG